MSKVICEISVSLDGYAAGPRQSREEPLGIGGERLHEWFFTDEPHPVDAAAGAQIPEGKGAYVMGRKMFAGEGPWDPEWRGWWGDEPPYHAPVFVLTHHQREPLEMVGTTFHFVNDGLEAAVERARAAAGDLDVAVAGGASTINQALAAGVVDELRLHLVPIVLGGGERLLVDVGDPALEVIDVVSSPAATHIRYRVVR